MTKIHLDTDIGGDLDDLCALAMVLGWPDADLVGVTTNCDDGGRRAGYARYALDLVGRHDVPVAAGADIALGRYRVTPGLPREDDYWPEPITPVENPLDEALDLLQASIEGGALICMIGAYSNLGLLEARSPGILSEADLVLMGGWIHDPRQGYPAWDYTVDWNLQSDVAASLVVARSSQDPLWVPAAVTVETALRRAHLPVLREAGPLARLIAHQAEVWARDEQMAETYGATCSGVPEDIINFQHDPLACAIGLGWREGVTIRRLPVATTVEDGWLRQRVTPGARLERWVTEIDGPKLGEVWLEAVTRG